MKSVLLYYPFQLAKNANSGSKLRPIKMYQAFQEWGKAHGVNILLLSGSSEERNVQFQKWKVEGKLDNLLFCYMENQTIPFWLTDAGHIPKNPFVDRKVMSYLKKRGVPVGVFYRDVYWKFDELYPLKGIKKGIMQSIYRFEEKFYEKYCEVVFLPSEAMGKYVDINIRKVPLPPGGQAIEVNRNRPNVTKPANGLYVGGINNEDYGLFLLLDSLKEANREGKVCQLTIVCREDEFAQLPDEKKQLLNDDHVRLLHISGKELDDLYGEMDFAFIPRLKSTYNDFSVPVKLVEYLSHHLPVIATYCDAQKAFIESGPYGLICEDSVASMARAIKQMCEQADEYRQNIEATFLANHSWLARVEKISRELQKEDV